MILVDEVTQITTVIPASVQEKILRIANKYGLGYQENVPERNNDRIKYLALEIWDVEEDISITELVQDIKSDHEFAYGKDCLWFCTEAPTIRRKIKR
jgi:hypothetical protein